MELREDIRVILRKHYCFGPKADAQLADPVVDAILALPEIREALNHYEACQSALDALGEFTVTRENFPGVGGVTANRP